MTQLVLVEFNNTAPFLYEFHSHQKISINRVVKYFIEKEDLNEEKDTITFLDKPSKIKL